MPTRDELKHGLIPLLVGLVIFGIGIGLMLEARLGLGSWDVFHQGVSDQIGLSVGTVTLIVGGLLLVGFPLLGERPGVGTICNVLVIGPVVDLTLAVVPEPGSLAIRVLCMIGGPVLIGLGSGLYIGAGLGPGPRDGIMTGIAARGVPVWIARTGIEVTVLVAGLFLGGTVGLGTIWFAVSIGPLVQFFLHHVGRRLQPSEATTGRPAPDTQSPDTQSPDTTSQ